MAAFPHYHLSLTRGICSGLQLWLHSTLNRQNAGERYGLGRLLQLRYLRKEEGREQSLVDADAWRSSMLGGRSAESAIYAFPVERGGKPQF